MDHHVLSLAMTGSGGAGVMTVGQILVDAAARAGWYGLMRRSLGPQIRGGESAALMRFGHKPILSHGDSFDLLLAYDWGNINRFAAELPLRPDSVVLFDPDAGDVPEVIERTDARCVAAPLAAMAKTEKGVRANMVGLGLVAAALGLTPEDLTEEMTKALGDKGEEILKSSLDGLKMGAELAADLPAGVFPAVKRPTPAANPRWSITGNEAAGLGAIRGGVRFVAAYPITPSTEILEWLAPNLAEVGGQLVQVEDELASVNMLVGASFGGIPSLTATSGPGLSLMLEGLGLSVSAEVPLTLIDVQRGGPSTGIPTKSEQSDFNIAVYGMHGDAPHIVCAPTSIPDCLSTVQWAVASAEAAQCPAIVLSDQYMGQSRAIVDQPPSGGPVANRRIAAPEDGAAYKRYALTNDGVSPMSVPGVKGGEYTADGLAHNERGTPSTQASDHQSQLDKRERKLDTLDCDTVWAETEGSGPIAVIAFGSLTEAAREAVARAQGDARLIGVRVILPLQPEAMAEALKGVSKVLVVEQNHGAQFAHFLKGHYALPATVESLNRPGPLPIRPTEIFAAITALKGDAR